MQRRFGAHNRFRFFLFALLQLYNFRFEFLKFGFGLIHIRFRRQMRGIGMLRRSAEKTGLSLPKFTTIRFILLYQQRLFPLFSKQCALCLMQRQQFCDMRRLPA